MNHSTRFAMLRIVVLISLAFRCSEGDAVGLGPMRLQSALGQPLRATVQVLGVDARTLSEACIRSRLTSPDGSEISRPEIELRRSAGRGTEIAFTGRVNVEEPAVTLLVDITCSPTLHRDYQLLLDLRDGLPRVLPTAGEERPGSLKRVTAESSDGAGDGSASRRKKKKLHKQVAATEPGIGAAEPEEMPAGPGDPPVRAQARGLPGSRNVLKLSQDDVSFGAPVAKTTFTGLKLSDTLSAIEQNVNRNTEDIIAAKARFMAMMRNEDPLLASQKEIRSLQARLKQNAAPVDAPGNGTAKAQPAAGLRGTPLFNTWLLGLSMLVLATLGLVALLFRNSRKRVSKKTTPWWQAADAAATREEELLLAARASVEKKKAAAAVADRTPAGSDTNRDQALERYVERFVGAGEKNDNGNRTRQEPAALKPQPYARDSAATPDVMPAVVEPPAASAFAPAALPAAPAPPAAPSKQALAASRIDADPFEREPDDHAPLRPSGSSLATAELVSDVMQEAEFWKMLNETQRAIDILENYCSAEASASPVPWLYLAEMYGSTGDVERREQLRERFRQNFNGSFDADDGQDGRPRDTLEDYPHLIDKLTALWGHEEVMDFLHGLLINDRDAPREGFFLPVYREILLLIDVARERENVAA